MSDNTIVQVVIFAVVALVVVVAVLWGRGRVKLKLPGVDASVEPDEKRTVSVAEKTTFESAEVGDIIGERRAGAGGTAAREVNVMNGSVVRGGKIGDITGVDESGSSGKQCSPSSNAACRSSSIVTTRSSASARF